MSTDVVVDTDRANRATRAPRRSQSAGRTLESADPAAARRDIEADAGRRSLDESGHPVDPVYANRGEKGRSNVEPRRVGSSQWFG